MVQKMGYRRSLKAFNLCSYEIVVIEDRLMKSLRKKWKMLKGQNYNILLQTSIPNIGLNINQEGLLIVLSLIPLLISLIPLLT